MLRHCGRRWNAWSSHLSSKRTVVEAYEQLTRKGVIAADPRQRAMAEACTPLLALVHQCHADEVAGRSTSYPRLGASSTGRATRPSATGASLPPTLLAGLARRVGRLFPDSVTRTLGLVEAENIGAAPKRGLYLWGDVGIGKTMVLDLFDLCATPYAKRRSHLHSFMNELADRLFRAELALSERRRAATSPRERQELRAIRPIHVVVQEVLHETPILCFDEFQTFDVAHAALLASFFTEAFRAGLFLVTTSNRPPEDLCCVSASFTAFLPVLRQHCSVLHCPDIRDYRVKGAEEHHHHLVFLHPNTKANMERLLRRVEHAFGTGGGDVAWVREDTLWHHGRSVMIPVRCGGCAVFNFTDICGAREGLSSSDIQHIAQHFHTVLVTNVPHMGKVNANAAHQFVVLVDELYQNNVKLLFTCTVPWNQLMDTNYAACGTPALAEGDVAYGGVDAGVYSEGEDDRSGYTAHYDFRNAEELMSFARIHSRLNEMGSSSYLLRDHRHFVVSDFDFSSLLHSDIQKKVCG
ncbi:ATPase [Novymonas esmeraldas]|uniref:ATPase n=1 Tax=Novymonas esmeraldas TaxID=1808958 RepID=A0AAW0F7X0_9TRYP